MMTTLVYNATRLVRCTCFPESECEQNQTWCATRSKCFKHTRLEEDGMLSDRLGCISHEEIDIGWRMQCRISETPTGGKMACCDDTDFCNSQLVIDLTSTGTGDGTIDGGDGSPLSDPLLLTLYVILPAFVLTLTVIAVAMLVVSRRRERRRQGLRARKGEAVEAGLWLKKSQFADATQQSLLEDSVSSGSGSGLPMLVQRTIARQIELDQIIGKGRYGEVWRGSYQSSTVAVKIFNSREELAWRRELEVYHTPLLRHDGILTFLAADVTSGGSATQLWLVTQYHPAGSLYEVLIERAISVRQLLKMTYTTIAGIARLHLMIPDTQGKPPIAHCDIKSKNVLVKADGSCCVADLGMAVIGTDEKLVGLPVMGTRRYAAPELLDNSADFTNIESYLRTDIYATALLMWELVWRTAVPGVLQDYQPPFYDVVPSDPTVPEMRKIVCGGERPPLLKAWDNHSVLRQYVQLMQESWAPNPAARLSALRLKKSLWKLLESAAQLLDDKDPTLDCDVKTLSTL